MTLCEEIVAIIKNHGMTIESYGWVCVAASWDDVQGYTFQSVLVHKTGEPITQRHVFRDLVSFHLDKVVEPSVDFDLHRDLLALDKGLLVGVTEAAPKRFVLSKNNSRLSDVVRYADGQVGGQFYNNRAYEIINQADLADWESLQDSPNRAFLN